MKFLILTSFLLLLLPGCATEPAKSVPPASSGKPVSTSLPAVHEISPDSLSLSDDALKAYGRGDYRRAITLSDEALSKDPKNYKALSTKGISLAFSGSPDEGAASVAKALSVNPTYVQGFYDMAIAQKLGKHYDASISYFQKVLAADPQNTWSYYGIATNYADKRDKAEALSYLQKAIALDTAHVKPEARTQDHFEWLHGDKDFESLVK